MMGKRFSSTFLLGFMIVGVAQAGEFLDPPYHHTQRVVRDLSQAPSFGAFFDFTPRLPSRAIVPMGLVTEVKSQEDRGTCSIFSATAMIESMMIAERGMSKSLDLSEEWLEYLVMRQTGSEGSEGPANLAAALTHGMAEEQAMPYIGETWEKLDDSPLAQERCGHLRGRNLTKCLLGHWDPSWLEANDSDIHSKEFLKGYYSAQDSKGTALKGFSRRFAVSTQSEVRRLLAEGHPVILEVDFYYGAWNHREADDLGIGRDSRSFSFGLVGYPEKGSLDRKLSPTSPAGHSILVVGYDDNIEITTRQKMQDGTTKTFTYHGAYIFKNSWGTSMFGRDSQFADGLSTPGFGAMTYEYAEEFGSFFKLEAL